jgi:hypothetical protein
MSNEKNNNSNDSYNKIEIDNNDPYLNEGYIKKVNSKKFIKTPSIKVSETTSEEIPQNWKFVSDSLKENDNIRESLLIYTATWNMKGQKPTEEEIKLILPKELVDNQITKDSNNLVNNVNTSSSTLGSSPKKQTKKDKFYHIYAIATQECMRSIFSSFFNSNKDDWLKMLQ